MNYLLKMPSDLNYLAEYRAVQTWLGFDIVRNPFCIPFPMEKGASLFSGALYVRCVDYHAGAFIF